MADVDVRNVIIIGSGPAGLTAAVNTARANLEPLVQEGEPSTTSDQPGGQLMLTTDVENYPGFPEGVLGPELMSRMRDQAARFGADRRMEKDTRVDLRERPFGVWLGDPGAPSPTFGARALIVATGAQSLLLGLPNEQELIGHGVSTCATCDGFFFREQDIAVVGGGDSALEEAIFLTKFARTVTIVHRRSSLRASKIMQDRAFENEKIRFRWNSVVESIKGDGSVEAVQLRDVRTGALDELPVSGLFVAIGHRPSTTLFIGMLDMDEAGYLCTEAGSTRTNVQGVFACGDVQDSTYRQAVTAAGSGCMAAIDAERWLEHVAHVEGTHRTAPVH
jgi:thioredoxin reductase (NADPH)